jgi:ABC-2 type transport system permease protein
MTSPAVPSRRMGVAGPVVDGLTVARRNLIKIKRVPDLLVFTTLSPIMFVLLFAYVFGGAIAGGNGAAYREFLIAGIFAQTVVFGATITGTGLAEDVKKGIIDRFRTLPMSPSAVLTGRTLSDVVNNVLVLVVMSVTGLIVGWRITTNVGQALLGYLLLLVFAYAVSWIMAWIGMLVPSPEVFNNAAFIVIFPLTFVANTFVPLNTLPGPLQTFAEWNPISAVTEAARILFGNQNPISRGPAPDSWALTHPALYTLLWALAILVVFVPLTNAAYRRSTSR